MDQQLKRHVMSCIDKNIYVGLKQPRIGYTNITTTRLFEYLYTEYGEKTERLQNKALADLEEEVDLTGPSIILFRLKQEKLLLFLSDTEQAILEGMYTKTCLRVIKTKTTSTRPSLHGADEQSRIEPLRYSGPSLRRHTRKND